MQNSQHGFYTAEAATFTFVSHSKNFSYFQQYLNSPTQFPYLQDEEWCKGKDHKANQYC